MCRDIFELNARREITTDALAVHSISDRCTTNLLKLIYLSACLIRAVSFQWNSSIPLPLSRRHKLPKHKTNHSNTLPMSHLLWISWCAEWCNWLKHWCQSQIQSRTWYRTLTLLWTTCDVVLFRYIFNKRIFGWRALGALITHDVYTAMMTDVKQTHDMYHVKWPNENRMDNETIQSIWLQRSTCRRTSINPYNKWNAAKGDALNGRWTVLFKIKYRVEGIHYIEIENVHFEYPVPAATRYLALVFVWWAVVLKEDDGKCIWSTTSSK